MVKKALMISLVMMAGSAFADSKGSSASVPVVPCYVNGTLIKSMPINICTSQYKGSTTQKESMEKMH